MSDEKNLWGDIEELPEQVSPLQILAEQASALGRATRGVLHGDVIRRTSRDGTEIEATLYVVAPMLDDYRYSVCHATYDPSASYPVRLKPTAEKNPVVTRCGDDVEFSDSLAKILQSPTVKNAVASLIRESKAKS